MISYKRVQVVGSIVLLMYLALLYNPSRARDGSDEDG